MKMLYLDCASGASGDMLLAAFLDGLVPLSVVEECLQQLPLEGVSLSLQEVTRNGMTAKLLQLNVAEKKQEWRRLPDIERLLHSARCSEWIKAQALVIFRRLAEVEAHIHHTTPDKIHFHEIGAVDTIVDVIGTLACVEHLQPDVIFASPLPVGYGQVAVSHGDLPLPAPATLELLKGFPLRHVDVAGELVTPTGAALVTSLAQGTLPAALTFRIEKIGYGAGHHEFQGLPNVLRIWQGEVLTTQANELALAIETNIDDMNPEMYPYLMEKLLEEGVMDVALYPNIMKKGRPGVLIHILCDPVLLPTVKEILFRETTTLGFRYHYVYREKVQREVRLVESPWGKVRAKRIQVGEKVYWRPEFEECRRIARDKNMPLPEVYQQLIHYFAQNLS